MNVTIIIIGLAILGVFIVPTVYISYSASRKKKKFLSLITEFAENQSCKISDYDQWKDSCIGIDRDKHKIFYISKNSGNLVKTEISLQDVAKCKLKGVNMTGNTISDSHKAIDEIVLCYNFKDPDKKDISVEYFKISTDFTIVDDDLKLAEKWLKISQTNMSNLLNKS